MQAISFHSKLKSMHACQDALAYATNFSDLQSAWDVCERGDWMLWLLGRLNKSGPWSDGRKPLLAVALDCAETVSPRWSSETVELVAVLRQWVVGEASLEEAKLAQKKLWSSYVDAADAAAAAAAVVAAADAAADAVVADAAAAAAAADADAGARFKTLKYCADIVRRHYPIAPNLAEWDGN